MPTSQIGKIFILLSGQFPRVLLAYAPFNFWVTSVRSRQTDGVENEDLSNTMPATKKAATKKAVTKKAATERPVTKQAVTGSIVTNNSAHNAVDSPFKNFTPYTPKKSERYMGDAQVEHFRDILNKWRQELMEEVDRTVHHMRDEAANFPDPADRATQEEEFSIELRTRDRERRLIKKIDQTIDRLDAGDYGYCDTCGVEVGLRRLEARPTATQCVDCKSLDEIKERQLHG